MSFEITLKLNNKDFPILQTIKKKRYKQINFRYFSYRL